ncbi:glycosyl transferase family 90-domain-containing protein [Mycena vitilis]|nr:glycosyl transferase family 90-domain-containing protein [Mycena vitilis]
MFPFQPAVSLPSYNALRRRSRPLRQPAYILAVVCTIAFLARVMRDVVFNAEHSTHIAFKYAAGVAASTVTQTLWATPTERPAARKVKAKAKKSPPLGQHTYRPDGLLAVNPQGAHPIPQLIARAEAAWAAKHAKASKTLRQAAAEYTRRYGRLPPRGFDMWWAYTAVHNVPLPDEYDQIDADLAPFYGVHPAQLQESQRGWEAHVHSYTLGKDREGDGLGMLNATLPEEKAVREDLASPGMQIIELMREVEKELPVFRAVFSPHDSPNMVFEHELRQDALAAAKKGTYIHPNRPSAADHSGGGWRAACPPHTRAAIDALGPHVTDRNPSKAWPSVPRDSDGPKTFIHDPHRAIDPCTHPSHLRTHGAYLAHAEGAQPLRALVPQFSYSVTPLHGDIRIASPVNWAEDNHPPEAQRLSWAERTDARLEWRGRNTGITHGNDGRWREAHRIRLAAFAAGVGGGNVSILDPGSPSPSSSSSLDLEALEFGLEAAPTTHQTPIGPPKSVPRARVLPALLDVAFMGAPLDCAPAQCEVLREMFEWRGAHSFGTAAGYKYVLDVDGHGWSSRLKRLMNTGSLVFKATTYPEWFSDRIAPWVHYIPVQNSYSDLLDALAFFRAHDDAGARIASRGREWSRAYWRREDLRAYMYRLFLEYARVMSTDRAGMAFEMWPWVDEREDAKRERALKARWEVKL